MTQEKHQPMTQEKHQPTKHWPRKNINQWPRKNTNQPTTDRGKTSTNHWPRKNSNQATNHWPRKDTKQPTTDPGETSTNHWPRKNNNNHWPRKNTKQNQTTDPGKTTTNLGKTPNNQPLTQEKQPTIMQFRVCIIQHDNVILMFNSLNVHSWFWFKKYTVLHYSWAPLDRWLGWRTMISAHFLPVWRWDYSLCCIRKVKYLAWGSFTHVPVTLGFVWHMSSRQVARTSARKNSNWRCHCHFHDLPSSSHPWLTSCNMSPQHDVPGWQSPHHM